MADPLDKIRGIDIYLLDQILKGRYHSGESILDAGCGGGRNLKWFIENGLEVHACDIDAERISELKDTIPGAAFQVSDLASLPYSDAKFDHIICSAVLHFSKDEDHFMKQFSELSRVLKQGGSLFVRMCSFQGLDSAEQDLGDGRFLLKDGTERFVATSEQLKSVMEANSLHFLELPKSVNVNELRSMSVWVFQKA